MKIMQICTKRLNLNLSQRTYDVIRKVALKDGRKPGSLARKILDEWANERVDKKTIDQKKKIQK
jgi:hypothetical protein